MKKNQIAIKKQLHKYILSQHISGTWADLLDEGQCYFFSLGRSAMRITGKLAWWEACLNAILAWDGQLASLDKTILLPGALGPVTLKSLFERVIHYLILNNGSDFTDFNLLRAQATFLLPNGPFFIIE